MAGGPQMPTLIVDDEHDVRLLIRLGIEARNQGLSVAGEASDGYAALDLLESIDPLVVVLDHRMPGMDGIETARRILERRPGQLIVLFSAFLDEVVRAEAAAAGIAMSLDKSRLKELPEVVFSLASGN